MLTVAVEGLRRPDGVDGDFAPSSALVEAPQTFDLKLEGCISGHSMSSSSGSLSLLAVVSQDRGCLLKLISFTSSLGRRYAPLEGHGFSTWQKGDRGVFVNEDKKDPLIFSIKSQLSDPIQPTDTVAYGYSTIVVGSNFPQPLSKKWDRTPIDSGQSFFTPRVMLRRALLSRVDPVKKKLFYTLYFECEETVNGSGCYRMSASDMDLSLSIDKGDDCAASNSAQCDVGPFKSGFVFVPQGNPLVPKGGFYFPDLEIPTALNDPQRLVLAVRRRFLIFLSTRLWNFDNASP